MSTTSISDTFTDTAGILLSSHTPDTGGSWIRHPSYTTSTEVISNANRCRHTSTDANIVCYYNSVDPGADNYTVGCDLYAASNNTGATGVAARIDTSTNTMYTVRWYFTTGAWELYKFVNGTATKLGSVSESLTSGNTYPVKLIVGAGTQQAICDSTLAINASDTSITARGMAGLRDVVSGASEDQGLHYDNFLVTYDGGIALAYAATEILSLTEVHASAMAHTIAETLALSDVRTSGAGLRRAETIALTDARLVAAAKAIAQALTLSDTRLATVGKAIVQMLTLTDVVGSGAFLSKGIAEVLTLADIRKANVGALRAETLSLTDAGIIRAASKAIAQELILTDTRAAALSRRLAEALSISDAAAARVFGATLAVLTVLASGGVLGDCMVTSGVLADIIASGGLIDGDPTGGVA